MHARQSDEPIVIDDPRAAKALAHQTRLEILQHLHAHGEATVTRLAETLEESTASVSYHIAQLARFGFVVRAPGEGRHKPWRATSANYTFGFPVRADDAERDGTQALVETLLDQGLRIVREFVAGQADLPVEWQRGSVLSNRTCYVTADELHDVSLHMLEHLEQYQGRTAVDKPADARPAHFLLRAVPAMPAPGLPTTGGDRRQPSYYRLES